MIELNKAIEHGAWLKVKTDDIVFRFKPTEFSKIDLSSIDNPEKLTEIGLHENIWLLKLSIINLNKYKEHIASFYHALKLSDEEGYIFSHVLDMHLENYLLRELNLYKPEYLPPKITKHCKITYELPDDFGRIFLTTTDGSIIEE